MQLTSDLVSIFNDLWPMSHENKILKTPETNGGT